MSLHDMWRVMKEHTHAQHQRASSEWIRKKMDKRTTTKRWPTTTKQRKR